MPDVSLHAIIPAGGAGTRLWPLSRQKQPKFLADLTGSGQTLIQQTVARLEPLTDGNVIVVTGGVHADEVSAQLPNLGRENIIAEPSPRDSMAAIGLAAAIIARREGDVVVGSFAADHVIQDEGAFRIAVSEAVAAANKGYVATIGITPDRPATGFGYIHSGEIVDGCQSARSVSEFLEKPDLSTAQQYVATGEYRWNAGMFVARTSVLLDALQRFEPELFAGINEIAQAWQTPQRADVLARVWPTLKKIAIDHAIAEPLAAEGGVAVVPVEMGWSDIGDYASLRTVIGEGAHVAPGGVEQPVLAVDAAHPFVMTHAKPVVVLGIDDVVVVEADEAIFVTTADRSQDVKTIVDQLGGTIEYLR